MGHVDGNDLNKRHAFIEDVLCLYKSTLNESKIIHTLSIFTTNLKVEDNSSNESPSPYCNYQNIVTYSIKTF